MSTTRGYLVVAAVTFLLNLPFGYWRATTRRFSPRWFVAVHGPVPLIAALRLSLGVAWSWTGLPLLVPAYFCGQWLGARLRRPDAAPE